MSNLRHSLYARIQAEQAQVFLGPKVQIEFIVLLWLITKCLKF